VKVREVIKMLEANGWYLAYTKGSHRQFRHPHKLGKVTVSGKPGRDIAVGTYLNILKQAGLRYT
jgi:predicted RNA binding protein YcfA (HicA-like mRNA interferase family)